MEATVNVGAARLALNPTQGPAGARKAPTSTRTPKNRKVRLALSLRTTKLGPQAISEGADSYRDECVFHAKVGLGMLHGAATGQSASGPSRFAFEPDVRTEIAELASRLMTLVCTGGITARAEANPTLTHAQTLTRDRLRIVHVQGVEVCDAQ